MTTSGTGHIRFWKLAATFTGLKLKGSIGKFGKVELSDVAAFVECPDGKVISGTESGSILLWEGNFIKCRFVRPGGLSCHDGEITYIDLDRAERRVITASIDGFIRWWNFTVIDTAEVDSDNSINFELTPSAEYCTGSGKGVKMMVDSGPVGEGRTFYIVDTEGTLSSIYFFLGEEPEKKAVPGLVKRRTIKDLVPSNSTKKYRKLSAVVRDMPYEFKNMTRILSFSQSLGEKRLERAGFGSSFGTGTLGSLDGINSRDERDKSDTERDIDDKDLRPETAATESHPKVLHVVLPAVEGRSVAAVSGLRSLSSISLSVSDLSLSYIFSTSLPLFLLPCFIVFYPLLPHPTPCTPHHTP